MQTFVRVGKKNAERRVGISEMCCGSARESLSSGPEAGLHSAKENWGEFRLI